MDADHPESGVLIPCLFTLLAVAHRVRFQDHRQRGHKVYALHAPEVECIGKGKARAPYEFGCKVSIATPATKPKGGQFVLHAKALHGNPFDGHTLDAATFVGRRLHCHVRRSRSRISSAPTGRLGAAPTPAM